MRHKSSAHAGLPRGWLEGMSAHLVRHLGSNCQTITEIVPAGPQMDLFVHEPIRSRQFTTVVTSGLSWQPMRSPRGQPKYAELVAYLSPEWDLDEASQWWPGKLLKQLGRMVREHDSWLAPGHTIQNEDPPEPYVEGSQLTHTLILEVPEGAEFKALKLKDARGKAQPIHFLWAFPITTAECELVRREHSAEPLIDAFGAEGPPRVLNPWRPCAVSHAA